VTELGTTSTDPAPRLPQLPRLSRWGRAVRLIAVAATLILLGVTSFWGRDDDFPFAPFHMYSTRGNPNAVARELRVQLVAKSGQIIDVTNAAGAPRRAELEGQIDELAHDLDAVRRLVPLYTAGTTVALKQFRLVWEDHSLHNGRTAGVFFTLICSVDIPS
jgi:hypothetical protein